MPKISLANDTSFESFVNTSLLDSARAQGITIEHSCRTGRCGVCEAHVISGTTRLLNSEEALTKRDQSSGLILTCCRTAVTDLVLDIEDIGDFGSIEAKTLPCRIDSLKLLKYDVIEVSLRIPPSSRLNYRAGQYIDVIAKSGVRRSYSVANAPRLDARLTLQIRRVAGGELSRYWFDEAKPGDLLRLEGPLGTFCLRSTKASVLVLLATGTGIAPIKAMLEDLASKSSEIGYRSIYLYWGGRTESDIYWVPNFPELPLVFAPVLSRSPRSKAVKGYVQDVVLADHADLQNAVVYACGSETMIASARAKLIAAGLSPKNFRADAFVSSC